MTWVLPPWTVGFGRCSNPEVRGTLLGILDHSGLEWSVVVFECVQNGSRRKRVKDFDVEIKTSLCFLDLLSFLDTLGF